MRLRTRIILGTACAIGVLRTLYPPWSGEALGFQTIDLTMLVVQFVGLACATGVVLFATMGKAKQCPPAPRTC